MVGVVTALTAVFGVFIALPLWQKKKVDESHVRLAEDTLALFFEAREKLAWVRMPGAFAGEGQSRKKMDPEGEGLAGLRDAYYVSLERLLRDAEFWGRFDAQRIRFRVIFGNAAAMPFQDIRRIRNSIASAAHMLIMTAKADLRVATEEDAHRKWERNKLLWENQIWAGHEQPDSVAEEIDSAILRMEEHCRPLIESKAK